MTGMGLVLLVGIAVARAVRLYRDDKITEKMRQRVDRWLDVDFGEYDLETSQWERDEDDLNRRERLRMYLSDLLECPWCLSGWLAAGAVVFIDCATPASVPLPALAWLASWWVAVGGYWLVESIADADSILYHEREQRGIDD